MAKLPEIKLKANYDKQRSKMLRLRGVDHQCFHGKTDFDVESCLVRVKCNLEHVNIKSISVQRQVRWISKLLNNPLSGSPVVVISSYTTDLKAKLLACQIMNSAIAIQTQTSTRKLSGKDLPLWHRVFGGYKDSLRDDFTKKNPSMLILTNITTESTQIKLEKVRDLLEMYDNIPRIVVLGGVSPIEFFATKLHYPIKYSIYMGPEKREAVALDI